jgi:putative transposase
VARAQGVSKRTIYVWKAKFCGMEVSEAEEVKHLRDGNARLKNW